MNRGEPIEIENDDGPELLKSEVKNAIKMIKGNEAPGTDRIMIEHIKALDEEALDILLDFCRQIYDTSIMPEDLRQSLIIRLAKKCKAMECTEYRTISLMSHMIKIMLQIILNRNEKKIDNEIGEMQPGFKASAGTREGIFNLREILDKYLGIKKNIYICFIDYEKAFDRVYHKELIETVKRIATDGKDTRFIQNLHWNQYATIKLKEVESNKLQIKREVRQGCILSQSYSTYTRRRFSGKQITYQVLR